MTYKIKLTDNALRQLRETVGYISKVLHEPHIARHWSDRIKKEILTLDRMPLRYPLVDEEPWRTEGIHKMTVENFIISRDHSKLLFSDAISFSLSFIRRSTSHCS